MSSSVGDRKGGMGRYEEKSRREEWRKGGRG